MFDKLRKLFSSDGVSAATQLPSVATPKVRPGSATFPSFFTSTKNYGTVLPQTDRNLASKDVTTYRTGTDSKTIIRDFVASSPDLSAAVWAYMRIGIPQGWSAVAKNMDSTFNRDATMLVQQILTRFDILPDYITDGFTGPQSLRSVSESLAKELIMHGSACGEMVLDKARMPKRVQPISTTQIKFVANPDKTLTPWQYVGSEKISLDTPTFVYVTLDQSLLSPYSESPIESSIKPAIFSEQFANDINRVVGKVIHPRQKVQIDEEKVRKYLSPEAQMDPVKATEELNVIVASIENKINGLKPEDALVYLDSLDFVVENSSNSGLSSEYETLKAIANARLSAGSKTNGTVLGFSSGSSNIASAEMMLMVRSCTGAVKAPLEEFWSRTLTLAARLMGQDVTVEFKFDPIDLRPDAELMSFKQTEQAMVLEQLSLGLISDDEASLRLNKRLAPAGMAPLSGTRFKDKVQQSAGGTGDTADPATPSNGGSTLNQNLKPDTPATGRGQNKKAEDEGTELEADSEPAAPMIVAPNLTMNFEGGRPTASVIKMSRDDDGNLIVTREVAA